MRKIEIIGRLADNAEIKQSQDRQFLTFRVAANEGSAQNQTTEWFDCTSNAVNIAQYLTKGKQVYCAGVFNTRTYDGKDGQTHTVLCIRVRDIELLGSKDGNSAPAPMASQPMSGGFAQQPASQPSFQPNYYNPAPSGGNNELPF